MDKEYYGRVARCHQYCEKLVSDIASKLSEKCQNPILRSIAKLVSLDCLKHSELLGYIADLYGIENFDIQDCSRYSGAAYGLYGYLKEVDEKIDDINSDEEVKERLESVLDMVTSIAMTDRVIISEGFEGEVKRYFMDVLIQMEDDEFKHLSLIRDYLE